MRIYDLNWLFNNLIFLIDKLFNNLDKNSDFFRNVVEYQTRLLNFKSIINSDFATKKLFNNCKYYKFCPLLIMKTLFDDNECNFYHNNDVILYINNYKKNIYNTYLKISFIYLFLILNIKFKKNYTIHYDKNVIDELCNIFLQNEFYYDFNINHIYNLALDIIKNKYDEVLKEEKKNDEVLKEEKKNDENDDDDENDENDDDENDENDDDDENDENDEKIILWKWKKKKYDKLIHFDKNKFSKFLCDKNGYCIFYELKKCNTYDHNYQNYNIDKNILMHNYYIKFCELNLKFKNDKIINKYHEKYKWDINFSIFIIDMYKYLSLEQFFFLEPYIFKNNNLDEAKENFINNKKFKILKNNFKLFYISQMWDILIYNNKIFDYKLNLSKEQKYLFFNGDYFIHRFIKNNLNESFININYENYLIIINLKKIDKPNKKNFICQNYNFNHDTSICIFSHDFDYYIKKISNYYEYQKIKIDVIILNFFLYYLFKIWNLDLINKHLYLTHNKKNTAKKKIMYYYLHNSWNDFIYEGNTDKYKYFKTIIQNLFVELLNFPNIIKNCEYIFNSPDDLSKISFLYIKKLDDINNITILKKNDLIFDNVLKNYWQMKINLNISNYNKVYKKEWDIKNYIPNKDGLEYNDQNDQNIQKIKLWSD